MNGLPDASSLQFYPPPYRRNWGLQRDRGRSKAYKWEQERPLKVRVFKGVKWSNCCVYVVVNRYGGNIKGK
ncbi:hypothetical protein L6452_40072 [Arctium lappa]|uniref:Uncharacterized protein n=1 Tax=Arctium lappa TaxID=4217 RepID=A0ACB8XU27_ARCLA|nr:hypothetical protein L6452_40072 [Arctium lappa]